MSPTRLRHVRFFGADTGDPMRAIVSVILCLFLSGCFPTKISPFSAEDTTYPLPSNSILYIEEKFLIGKNFNVLDYVGVAFNSGVRLLRDGDGYKIQPLVGHAKLLKDAESIGIQFIKLPSHDDYYLIEVSSEAENEANFHVTLLAGITGNTIQLGLLNPGKLPPEITEPFKRLQSEEMDPKQLKRLIFELSSQVIALPDTSEQFDGFKIKILNPVDDKKKIELIISASIEATEKSRKADVAREHERNIKKLLDSAKDKYSEDDFAGAVEDYTTYLDVHPESRKALKGRIDAYVRLDKNSLAYKDHDTLIALFPDEVGLIYDKGFRQYIEDDYLDAIETLTQVINHPNRSFSSLGAEEYLAKSYVALGRFEEALAEFFQVLETAPNSFTVLRNISETYKEMDDFGKAVSYLTEAIDNGVGVADYKFTFALRDRAELYESMQRYGEAATDWSTIISGGKLFDNYSEYYNRGKNYIQLGELQKAINDFTYALDNVEKSWDFADNFWSRGYTFLLLENYTAAIEDYSAYIELNDSYSSAFHNRGYAYRKLGKDDLADADFERAEALKKK